MKIICFGDSNTYGYDPRDYFGRPYDVAWPQLIEQATGFEIINGGQPGREIPSFEAQFQRVDRELQRYGKADRMFVMLGTNDILNMHKPDAKTVAQRMNDFIMFLNQYDGRMKICIIIPPCVNVEEEKYHIASGALISEYNILANQYGIDILNSNEWEVPLAFDGIHISEAGQVLFADQIIQYLSSERGEQ